MGFAEKTIFIPSQNDKDLWPKVGYWVQIRASTGGTGYTTGSIPM
jgi:hypothetical protein